MGKIVNLNNVILNWPQVFTPQRSKNYPKNDPRYSVQCLVEPNSPNHHAVVNAINEQVAENFPNGCNGTPKIDTDLGTGLVAIRAASSQDSPPGVIDARKNEILNPAEIYSGCICNVAIDVYSTMNYQKVAIGLLGIQKVKDGPRLDNRPDPKELFSPISTVENLTVEQPEAPSIGKLLG